MFGTRHATHEVFPFEKREASFAGEPFEPIGSQRGGEWIRLRESARRAVGKENGAMRPLEGLRIIEIATYVAGPSGGMALAQLGAEVVRLDPVGGATDTRRLPLDSRGNSLYWAGLNKGKRSVEVDFRSPAGRALVADLIRASGPGGGILLTNAVGQDWLEYDSLVEHRPDLIEVHIAGRPDGRPAVDYTVNCEVGLPFLTGPSEYAAPVNHVLPAWDLLTGLHAAIGILVAERERSRSGRGQLIRVNLSDVAAATMGHLGFLADVVLNGGGRLREGNYLYGSFGCDFATADGRRVMVVALTQRHWRKLVELTGLRETIAVLERSLGVDLAGEEARYRYREVLAALFRPWFASRDYDEVVREVEAAQLLWGPYRTVEELLHAKDSILATSSLFEIVEHPGIGAFPAPRSVLQLGAFEPAPVEAAPRLGADTSDVLGSWLGLDGEAITRLRAAGTVGGP